MFFEQDIKIEKHDRYQDGMTANIDSIHWLHYENPTSDEVNKVLQEYKLPQHFGDYIFDQFETSWIEYYHTDDGELFTYIIIQYPFTKELGAKQVFHTAPLVIVKGHDTIITFIRHTDMPFMQEITHHNYPSDFPMTSTYAFVMYIFFEVAQAHIEAVKTTHNIIQKAEEEARHSTKNDVSYALINVNRGLVYLSTAVANNAKTLDKISQDFAESEKDTRYHEWVLNRVQIEMNQAETMMHNDLSLIEKLNDMLNNVISNNLNDVMKRLTVITIVMTVPTITAGIWGMNVALPFENNIHGFSIVVVGSLILSIIIYYLLEKFDLFK